MIRTARTGALAPAVETWRMWQVRWRTWVAALAKRHALPLGVILVASSIGQAAVLLQRPLAYLRPDSRHYLAIAHGMLVAHHFIDPLRTSVYPAFLALIFALTGGEHLNAVVAGQIGLTVITTFEVYVLIYRLDRRRVVAAIIAGMMGMSPLVANWERTILTETLCYWLMVTLFLIFERYLTRPRTATLVWFALLSAVIILTRPQFIFLPALVLFVLALRSLRMGAVRTQWKGLVVVCMLAYFPVLAYMGANALTNQYFGLSKVSNLNLFGKVLEYRLYQMPDATADPRIVRFQADLQAFLAATHQAQVVDRVWSFVGSHPQYDAGHWAIYADYSTRLIKDHPFYYLQQTVPDLFRAWLAPPDGSAQYTYLPAWIAALVILFIYSSWLSLFVPLVFATSVVQVWRRRGKATHMMIVTLACAAVGNTNISAFTDFTEFGRLHFPLDWAITAVVLLWLIEWLPKVADRLAALRPWTAAAQVR